MIRSLRRAHLRRSLLMASLLPIGLGAALLARGGEVLDGNAHPGAPAAHASGGRALGDFVPRGAAAEGAAPSVRAFLEADGAAVSIELGSEEHLALPDLLVYWSATADDGADAPSALAADALLLGSFSGAGNLRVPYPAVALRTPGRLLLFSLAHGEVVGELATGTSSSVEAR